MPERFLKALAVASLALAIALVFASVRATLRAGDIQGPSAIVVLPSSEIWLGVDEALWRISALGQLLDEQPIRATGLPGPAANFVHGPSGSIVASVRGDATLYFLDAVSARVVRRLIPQWPPELQKHGGRAINFAFDAAGRVAISTGGGDAVALFDSDGRFVARTAPGTYVFTNGLWWNDEGLWTTDTNRFTLRLLDPATLLQRKEFVLGEALGGSFLGPARARPMQADARAPLAAIIRFRGGMTEGSLSLVGADARVIDLPHGEDVAPRDLDWLGDELLVTDGLSFSILRWSAGGHALPPFGDADLRQRLSVSASERVALRMDYMRWLVAAGIALAAGLLFAALVPWVARRAQPPIVLDLSHLGTPRISRMDLLRLHLRMYGWLMAMAVPMLALMLLVEIVPRDTLKAWLDDVSPPVLLGFALATLVLLMLPILMGISRLKRLSRLPVFEPVLNQRAMFQLKSHAQVLARALRDGEHVLEVFTPMPGVAWWVLTNQRLLAMRPALFDTAVVAVHELSDVRAASNEPGSVAPKAWWRRAAGDGSWLEVAIEGQLPISGLLGSPVLAERVVQRITSISATLRVQSRSRAPTRPRRETDHWVRRRRRAIASALLPGLGQWQQGRAAQAIVFIAVWVGVFIFGSGPMLWTLVEPFTGVRLGDVIVVVSVHLMLSGLAAADAWSGETLAAE